MTKKLILVVAFLLGPIYFIVAAVQTYLIVSGSNYFFPAIQVINSLLYPLGTFAFAYLATLAISVYLFVAYKDAKLHPTL